MKYYAYYGAAEDLSDDYTDLFILYMEAYYPGYERIFHNTKEHRIDILNGGAKESIRLSSAEEKSVKVRTLYDQNAVIHTALMKNLADRLSPEVTIVFEDIMSLGDTPGQILDVYEYFMHKKIYMAFETGKALDTALILSISGTYDPEIAKYIQLCIKAYCEEFTLKKNINVRLNDKAQKEKKELP